MYFVKLFYACLGYISFILSIVAVLYLNVNIASNLPSKDKVEASIDARSAAVQKDGINITN